MQAWPEIKASPRSRLQPGIPAAACSPSTVSGPPLFPGSGST